MAENKRGAADMWASLTEAWIARHGNGSGPVQRLVADTRLLIGATRGITSLANNSITFRL